MTILPRVGRPLSIVAALWLAPAAAPADILDSAAGGFTIRHQVVVDATTVAVYTVLAGSVDRWRHPDHTFSGDAGNLTIDASPGGCFCESFPNGGGVRHLEVVHANPGRLLALSGGLGPLQSIGVSGSMLWAIGQADDGVTVTLTYQVGGYTSGGLEQWAGPVDDVLGQQIGRLAKYVVDGRPE